MSSMVSDEKHYLTVGELVEELKKLPQELPVVYESEGDPTRPTIGKFYKAVGYAHVVKCNSGRAVLLEWGKVRSIKVTGMIV